MNGKCWVALLVLGVSQAGYCEGQEKATKPKTRDFLFTYGGSVTGLKPKTKARIWLPIPSTNSDQEIKIAFTKFPVKAKQTDGAKYGNRFWYMEANADSTGIIPFSVTYRVKRFEVRGDQRSKNIKPKDLEIYLKANKYIPLRGKPSLVLLKNEKLPDDQFYAAQQLYDIVNRHMKYDKPAGKPWGRGDAVWACDSKYGNCTDFHSLFISLARTSGIPSKFEIGFSLPPRRGKGEIAGYHCWAKFKPDGRGWIPVDISEANRAKDTNQQMAKYYFGNLTENRVTFTEGRDLILSPKQSGTPVNFLVYPYVEVDGRPYSLLKISRSFSFEDVK